MRRTLAMLVGALVALSGCAATPGSDVSVASIGDITIGASEDGAPTLEIPPNVDFTKTQSRLEWEGKGERLAKGDPVVLDMYSVSLATGDVLANTYVELPQAYLLAPELLGEDLYNALLGHRVGARILLVTPQEFGYEYLGSVAVVVDIRPSQAVGVPQPTRDDFPFVASDSSGAPILTFRDDVDLPKDLASAILIQGDGPQIRTGSRILINYQETSATTREVIQSTWPAEVGPWGVTVGQGQMPTGLEQSLIDVAEGSRIIVIVPPVAGYGDDRLVFIVDVLAVRDPV